MAECIVEFIENSAYPRTSSQLHYDGATIHRKIYSTDR